MEKYENLAVVGEGSYGLVMKCRHRETGQVVAIKKFIETEEDQSVRKMALREIRMLKKLRHENLVNMLEVFRRKRRFYLVFEYMDHTVLDELEEHQRGLGEETTRSHIFQVLRGLDFCHSNHIVHRDVKPENVLVSPLGVIKLCDFGFARLVASSPNETYTDYVATRWYRAPELLVGDTKYGREVDIWAAGCLFAEMLSGDPLFPGDSDIDQLFQICKLFGRLSVRHLQLVGRNPMLKGLRRSAEDGTRALGRLFPAWPALATAFAAPCLRLDPQARPSARDLLHHAYFTHDRFPDRFMPLLRAKVQQELQSNPLLRKHLGMATAAAAAAAAEAAATATPTAATRPRPAPAPSVAHTPTALHAAAGFAQAGARRGVTLATTPRWRFDLRAAEPSLESAHGLAHAHAHAHASGAGDADSARGRIAGGVGIGVGQGLALALDGGGGGGGGAAGPAPAPRRKLSDTAVELMEATPAAGGGVGGVGGGGGGGAPAFASLPPQPVSGSAQAAGDGPGSARAHAYHHHAFAHGPAHAPPQLLHPSINNLYFHGRDASSVFAAKLSEAPKRSPLALHCHLREPLSVAPSRHAGAATLQQQPSPASPAAARRCHSDWQTPPPPHPPPSQSQQQQQQQGERWLVSRRLAPAPAPAPAAAAPAQPQGRSGHSSSRASRGANPAADDFSLPNVPGASGSPNKGGKKKLQPVSSQNNMDSFLSPAIMHANPTKLRYWMNPQK